MPNHQCSAQTITILKSYSYGERLSQRAQRCSQQGRSQRGDTGACSLVVVTLTTVAGPLQRL